MEAIEFVKALRRTVLENGNDDYRNWLDKTENGTDPFSKDILQLYKNMTTEQKNSFLQFIQLVQVNAVSHILGILDGTSPLDHNDATFELRTESGDKPINGDLQDLFAEMEDEEEEKK